ncbi:MAG: glycoside hydrolase family 78 protein [Treponemataceae bacterium]|nr:glycoside hydrolase family 78 protein [Treponemataceae bacterium]
MTISNIRINHMTNPLGVELSPVTVSWTVTAATGKKQTAARVAVYTDTQCTASVYDTGKSADLCSTSVILDFETAPRTTYYVAVEVWSDAGEHAVSEPVTFETAKKDEEWTGTWITPDFAADIHPIIKKDFTLTGAVAKARLYMTGLGVYETCVNGIKAGNSYLEPGYHTYDFAVQYQTYDVTDSLKTGDNQISVIMGNGWYKGRFGFDGGFTDLYGDRFRMIAELHVTCEDGSKTVINSDESWLAAASPVTASGIYDGEIWDQTRTAGDWKPCLTEASAPHKLMAKNGPAIVEKQTMPVCKIFTSPKNETIVDLGQNMSGWVSFTCTAPAGTTITLNYFEELQDGCYYHDNLRSAKTEFVYVSDGTTRTVRPHFTFYGFRYVMVTGMSDADLKTITGHHLSSDIEETGFITTGNELLNKFISNTKWSQSDNFVDVPTDCPQRDERMGWTGDAQIFSGAASYHMYTPAFYTKWLHDVNNEQSQLEGSVPNVVPMPKPKHGGGLIMGNGASPWADVAVIIPWTMYVMYGDKTLLAQQYDGMKAWLEHQIREDQKTGNRGLILTGFHFADWLALDNFKEPFSPMGATDNYYVATAFYWYAAHLTAKAARVLGNTADAEKYEALEAKINAAFVAEYFSPTGRATINTQTALVIATFFNLLPQAMHDRSVNQLVTMIQANNNHFDTGFVGTPYICRTLSANGKLQTAYDLLLNEKFPGWLYEVKLGATTVWERWNSLDAEGHFSSTGMNSLNHYAYGSVVEWVYREVCGINPVEEAPGFKKIRLTPKPDGRLGHVECTVNTAAGEVTSAWKLNADGSLTFSFTIPFDCEAELVLPDAPADKATCTLSAGEHTITYTPTRDYTPHHTVDENMGDLMANPATAKVLDELLGGYLNDPANNSVFATGVADKSVRNALTSFPLVNILPWGMVDKVAEALSKADY